MKQIIRDWKDEAESFKEKALLLAILSIILMIFAVPEIKIKHYEIPINDPLIAIETINLEPIKIDLPAFQPKVIRFVFDEEEIEDGDETIMIELGLMDSFWEKQYEVTSPNFNKVHKIYEEMPSILKAYPKPKYTRFTREIGVEGTVVLEVLISKTGKVIEISVFKSLFSGPNGLDENSLNAVKQWEFKPAVNNGKAIDCWIKIPIGFKLK